MQMPGLRDCISWGLLAKHGFTLLLHAAHWGTGEHARTDLASGCSVSLSSARDPTLSPLSLPSPPCPRPPSDYIHKLLKTLPESEKGKFLEMLAAQPVIEQQPASGQAGAKASASQPSPPAATPPTPPEFCDTVAQQAYMQPASQAAPSATPKATAPAPQPGPAVAAAKPAGTADPAATAAKKAGTTAPKTVAQKQPPPKPAGPPAADPAANSPLQAQPKEKAPPPPLNADTTTADPPSQNPDQGAPSEADRAPLLAADAPASRVGSVINDGSGNPALCLVQLWACRRKCGVCENAFCQATHRCRDCKRAEGRARLAEQAPASSEENWQHSSWEWNSSAWTPAWGSQGGWQEGWHQGWHQ